MTLPFWARPPGAEYHHNDNYSDLEVVWTERSTGDVQIQTPHGYVDVAADVLELGPNGDIRDLAISTLDSNIRLAPRVQRIEDTYATSLEVLLVGIVAAFGGAGFAILLIVLFHP